MPIPQHVPPELVLECPIADRRVYMENIYETKLSPEHSKPAVYWCENIYVDGTGGWVVRKADDLREICADDDLFSTSGLSGFSAAIGESWDLVPLELGGTTHRDVRRTLNPELGPGKMAKLADMMRERARTLIAAFAQEGSCNFVTAFAVPFPVSIFLDLFGLPQELMPQFKAWSAKLQNPDPEIRAASTREIKHYLLGVIAERRADPQDDLITHATGYELDGAPWSDDMIFGYCFNMFIGGLDTVATSLSLLFHHLATHAEQQAALRADPRTIPLAIEELLRAYSPITVYRTVTRDTEFRGVRMLAGDRIAISFAIAARDPEAFEAPQAIWFERKSAHLGFGSGPHRCIGMHLARTELHVAFTELLAALPSLRVAAGEQVPFWIGNIISIRQLPLAWG